MPPCVTRATCRASAVSFTLSFEVTEVTATVGQKTAHAGKHTRQETALTSKGSHLGGKFGIIRHPRDDEKTDQGVKSLVLCDM